MMTLHSASHPDPYQRQKSLNRVGDSLLVAYRVLDVAVAQIGLHGACSRFCLVVDDMRFAAEEP
jgi:hypothetical protein